MRASRTTNATSKASESAPSASVPPAPQPSSAAGLTIVYTSSISEPVISTAPGISAPPPEPMPLSRASNRWARSAVTMPIGMLMKKIQCQLMAWVSTPPASSPIDPPAEATKA